MSAPILLTKLFIPLSRPELVTRSRLNEQLNRNLHRKLTLISAPARFGKTTLITDWLQSQGNDGVSPFGVGWLSLDEGDNEAVRFLSYLITALNRIQGLETEIGVGALQMLQSPQSPSLETVLTAVINEIAVITDKIVLILDDYHLIDSQQVHESLNFLIENLPPQLHLVITTCEDPPIPISRLRARGQLNELRAVDLRFTGEETAQFLNQVMGFQLSAADITALESRTEGWITGLQMAAISMQGRKDVDGFIKSFTGSNRYVLDYLIEEVLEQQTEEIHTFLMKTAVLDKLNGSLCDAVTGQESGQDTLEMLDRANLFITPLDDERRWYRYHHLFAELLRLRLQQTQPDLIPNLHQRASIWYGQQGFRVEAIDHALHGADYARAVELINADIEGNYEDVALLTLQRWLAAIPDKLVTTLPQMLLLKAWTQFNSGQIESADQSLMDVAQLLETANQLSNSMSATLSGRALAIRAFIVSLRGDFAGSTQFARQALDLLPAKEQAWRRGVTITLGEACAAQGQMAAAQHFRAEALKLSQTAGNPLIIMIANLNLAETLWQQGQTMDVIEICEHQMQFATDHDLTETPQVGWLLGLWGAALAELNQLDQALELTQKSVELTEHGQDMFYISYSYLYRVRVLFAAGDWSAVDDILQKMAHSNDFAHWVPVQISFWKIRIWLAEGKLDVATQWLNKNSLSIDGELPFVHEAEYVAVARVLLAQGKVDDAVELLEHLRSTAEIGGRSLRVIELLLLLALASHVNDDLSQALKMLEQALILGKSRGFIQTFVDEGPPMARLLYDALVHEILPDYVQQLLAAFPDDEPGKNPSSQPQISEAEWIEPLSEREIEVLQLIAASLSRQEIAAKLILSKNTVKTHARNIYSKLGVNNQMQAVGKARGLGFLENE